MQGKQSLFFYSDICCILTLGHVSKCDSRKIVFSEKRMRLDIVMLDKWYIQNVKMCLEFSPIADSASHVCYVFPLRARS